MSLLVTKGARALVKTTSSDDTGRLIFILRAAPGRRGGRPRARRARPASF